jgi:serpin B
MNLSTKRLIGTLPILAAALLAAGCGGGSGAIPAAQPAPVQTLAAVVRSGQAHDTNPNASADEIHAVVNGNNGFGLQALSRLGSDKDSNLVFSPYSITQAVAMAAAGAKGNTLSGIEQALSQSLPQERFNPALNKVNMLLQAKTSGATDGQQQMPSLNIVNTLWGQRGFDFVPAYLDTLAVNFDAGVNLVDFKNAPDAARISINSFIDDQTHGRIKDLLAEGALTAATRSVLTNAIWFKANWNSAFLPDATKDRVFFARNGTSANVPFMNQNGTLSGAKNSDYQAVTLPYAGGRMSMMLIMPSPGTFDAFVGALDASKLAAIVQGMHAGPVVLAVPKFTFTSQARPAELLRALGMTDAFDASRADFSGIDGARDLFISDVIHKAFIGIDENGTEAAAATALTMVTASMPVFPPPPLELTFDHPFLFAIRDDETGLVIFMGKVVKL